MSPNEKPAHSHTRILTDSARKKYRKGVLVNYNKTWINIGHQHDRWMELNETLRVQTNALKCKHQWSCACRISQNNVLYSCFEGIYQLSKIFYQNQWHYTFKNTLFINFKINLPRLLSGLFLRQTQIWWLPIGSEEVKGRKSSPARYSLNNKKKLCIRILFF